MERVQQEEMGMLGGKNGNFIVAMLLAFVGFFYTNNAVQASERTDQDIQSIIEQVIDWKKQSIGQNVDDPLFSNTYLKDAGNTIADWYPIGMGRIGYDDDYMAYIAMIDRIVTERYATKNKLSETKATEWHRITLAYLASGGDATNVGSGINLIADGTYNRGKTADLGTQGINGLIWGLIALDAMRYEVPKDAHDTRQEIIQRILALQLKEGGFAFDQKKSDVDMTAMAITALAPYYNSEETYHYTNKQAGKQVTKSVRHVIDEALLWLSKQQQKDGDFKSDGKPNLESTSQVVVALTSLHIDPQRDERFIKNTYSAVDGMMKYRQGDGGFIHAKTYNKNNPTSQPDESNSMASEQALYAFVALFRYIEGDRTLYDFRDEQTTKVKNKIYEVEQAIAKLKNQPNLAKQAFVLYKKVPIAERSYVDNYALLEDTFIKERIPFKTASLTANQKQTKRVMTTPSYFHQNKRKDNAITKQDAAAVAELVRQKPSTEQEVTVTKYLKQWKQADNASDFPEEKKLLQQRQQKIDKLKKEIASLNEEILDKLYPFEDLKWSDAKAVKEITARYKALPVNDRKQVIQYEDVEKAEVQINSLRRQRVITVLLVVVVIVLGMSFIIKKRRQKDDEE